MFAAQKVAPSFNSAFISCDMKHMCLFCVCRNESTESLVSINMKTVPHESKVRVSVFPMSINKVTMPDVIYEKYY